jgi:hypothetical protein
MRQTITFPLLTHPLPRTDTNIDSIHPRARTLPSRTHHPTSWKHTPPTLQHTHITSFTPPYPNTLSRTPPHTSQPRAYTHRPPTLQDTLTTSFLPLTLFRPPANTTKPRAHTHHPHTTHQHSYTPSQHAAHATLAKTRSFSRLYPRNGLGDRKESMFYPKNPWGHTFVPFFYPFFHPTQF